MGDAAEAMKELTKRGADICSPFTRQHGHILRFGINRNPLKAMRVLLQEPALFPELKLEEALSSLAIGDFGSPDAIVVLVDIGGIDVNLRLKKAGSLMAVAVCHCWEDTVHWLLEKGAELNMQFNPVLYYWADECRSALEAAACTGMSKLVLLLLEKGAHVSGKTVAFVCQHQEKVAKGELLRLLLERKPDLDETWTTCGHETSALIEAVFHGDVDNVRLLLQHGADVNLRVRGLYGDALNAVFVASTRYLEDYPVVALIEVLVEAGASIWNVADRLHIALAVAAINGLDDDVKFLILNCGANPNSCCNTGYFYEIVCTVPTTLTTAPRSAWLEPQPTPKHRTSFARFWRPAPISTATARSTACIQFPFLVHLLHSTLLSGQCYIVIPTIRRG